MRRGATEYFGQDAMGRGFARGGSRSETASGFCVRERNRSSRNKRFRLYEDVAQFVPHNIVTVARASLLRTLKRFCCLPWTPGLSRKVRGILRKTSAKGYHTAAKFLAQLLR